MGALFVDFNPFGESPTFPEVTDEQYKKNLTYINEQISIVNKRLAQIGTRRIREKDFQNFKSREFMNSLGRSWKGLTDEMLEIFCFVTILNQIKYSKKETRRKMTAEELLNKMDILEIRNAKAREDVLKEWAQFAGPNLGA